MVEVVVIGRNVVPMAPSTSFQFHQKQLAFGAQGGAMGGRCSSSDCPQNRNTSGSVAGTSPGMTSAIVCSVALRLWPACTISKDSAPVSGVFAAISPEIFLVNVRSPTAARGRLR